MPINKDKAKAVEKESKKELEKVRKGVAVRPTMKELLMEAQTTMPSQSGKTE